MTIELVTLGTLAVSASLLALVAVMQGRALRHARRETAGLRRELATVQQDLAALCAGANGVGHHLGRIDRHVTRLYERVDQIEAREQTCREYDYAVRMIQRGVGLEALIEQCGLPRAEADLLMRLHAPERARSVA